MYLSKAEVKRYVLTALCIAGFIAVVLAWGAHPAAAAPKKPTYTISATSKPYDKKIAKWPSYNKNTRHWYVLSSYMKRFEKTNGGTLILKKGTYLIPACIQVPSNVKLVFNDGVVIKKTRSTGTKKIRPNSSMFQLIPPSKYPKTGAVGKYNGTKNVSFTGKGKVTFDMGSYPHGCCIIMAHDQNITFDNITFKNCNAHFFELDASKNVTIKNCTFQDLTGKGKTDEAINLDTPDKKTGGFSFRWSKMDKTANKNVTITGCRFKNMNRAIGTHKYSQGSGGVNMMHEDIVIKDNILENVKGYEGAIVPYNWKNVTIENNVITGTGKGNEKTFAIVAHSVIAPKIKNNKISQYMNTILIRRGFTSSGYGAPEKISVTQDQRALLGTNSYVSGSVADPKARITARASYYTSDSTSYDLKQVR